VDKRKRPGSIPAQTFVASLWAGRNQPQCFVDQVYHKDILSKDNYKVIEDEFSKLEEGFLRCGTAKGAVPPVEMTGF
jgi:hypothetical protein